MNKVYILLIYFFLLSCAEKEKTYEELEAEVLCDVLPEVVSRFATTGHLLPPPPYVDSLNLNIKEKEKFNDFQEKIFEEYLINKKNYIDSITKVAKIHKKLKIGLINYLILPDLKKEYKIYNFSPINNERKINANEFINSTLDMKIISRDSVAAKGEFFGDSEINGVLIFSSRVLFNPNKDIAYIELYRYFDFEPVIVISRKINKKWVLKELKSGDGLPIVYF